MMNNPMPYPLLPVALKLIQKLHGLSLKQQVQVTIEEPDSTANLAAMRYLLESQDVALLARSKALLPMTAVYQGAAIFIVLAGQLHVLRQLTTAHRDAANRELYQALRPGLIAYAPDSVSVCRN